MKPIVDLCSSVTSRYGYERAGSKFLKRASDGNWATIEFQKSSRSTASEVYFTLNLYVHYRSLEVSEEPDNIAHLRQRIGALMPGRPDKWWRLADGASIAAVGVEMSDCLENYAIPYLDRFLDVNEIIQLWLAGEGPGLTDKQRLMYLGRARSP